MNQEIRDDDLAGIDAIIGGINPEDPNEESKDDESLTKRSSLIVTSLFILSLAGLIAFIVIEKELKDKMVHGSVQFSRRLQSHSENGGPALSVLSDVIVAALIAYVIFAFFLRRNKAGPFLRFFTLGVVIWLNVQLRLIYADGRPSYLSPVLRGFRDYCGTDFGNPSGHASTVVPISLLVAIDLYEESLHKLWFLILAVFVAAILSLAVIFIRLFLGVHFYDQLILGALWGIFIVMAMQFFRPLTHKFMTYPILYKQKYAKSRRKARVFLWLFILAVNIGVYVAFGIRYRTHGVGSDFYYSIVNCTYVLDNYHKNFATKLVAYGMSMNWIFFFFLGMNDSPLVVRNAFRFVEEHRPSRLFVRLLLLILINTPVVLAYIPTEDDVAGTIIRPAIIVSAFGYITGRFFPTFEKKLHIMPARPESLSSSRFEQEAEKLYMPSTFK